MGRRLPIQKINKPKSPSALFKIFLGCMTPTFRHLAMKSQRYTLLHSDTGQMPGRSSCRAMERENNEQDKTVNDIYSVFKLENLVQNLERFRQDMNRDERCLCNRIRIRDKWCDGQHHVCHKDFGWIPG